MFRIKVCGITCVADAIHAVDAGVDAIGLNFFAPSPRCLSSLRAAEIIEKLPARVAKVGIFVNHSRDEVAGIMDELALDYAQLHGDEPPEFVARLAPRRVIRAFRGVRQLPAIEPYLKQCEKLHGRLAAVLMDADVAGQYGGTGVCVDWDAVRMWRTGCPEVSFVLSGGLNPANIAEAIQAATPDAVDTASGVESEPGRKDPQLVSKFTVEARRGWEQSGV